MGDRDALNQDVAAEGKTDEDLNKKEKKKTVPHYIPRTGLVYSEKTSLSMILCKPKILPIKPYGSAIAAERAAQEEEEEEEEGEKEEQEEQQQRQQQQQQQQQEEDKRQVRAEENHWTQKEDDDDSEEAAPLER
jgi:hypothetical protein